MTKNDDNVVPLEDLLSNPRPQSRQDIYKRDRRLVSCVAFIAGLVAVLMTGFIFLHDDVESRITEDRIRSARQTRLVPAQPSQLCDQVIKTYRPKWAPKDVEIQCVDSLRGENGMDVWGRYYGGLKLIEISRKVILVPQLQHTILHEWAHSVSIGNKYDKTQAYDNWLKYLKTFAHVTPVGYSTDPEELLADNVARCDMGNKTSPLGLTVVDCNVVYALFPAYTIK